MLASDAWSVGSKYAGSGLWMPRDRYLSASALPRRSVRYQMMASHISVPCKIGRFCLRERFGADGERIGIDVCDEGQEGPLAGVRWS